MALKTSVWKWPIAHIPLAKSSHMKPDVNEVEKNRPPHRKQQQIIWDNNTTYHKDLC